MKKTTTLRSSYDNTFFYGLATSAVNALSTGPLVTAYALALGAGTVTLGCLQAVWPIANLVHLPVSYFIEKGKSLKKIAVFSSLISRPFWLIAALAAFWKGSDLSLTLFTISYFLAFIIGSIAGGAFLPWIKELVYPRLMNGFFAHRIKYILLTRILFVSMATGIIWVIQRYYPDYEIYTYSFFFAIAFLMGLYATWTLYRISDKPIVPVKGKSFFQKIVFTFKNKSFVALLFSLSSINFSMNFITPFTVVFMLTYLKLSVGMTMLFTILWQLTDSFTITHWSKRTKTTNVNKTLIEASYFYICGGILFLLTLFSTNYPIVIFSLLILAHFIIGIGSAGLNLGINDVAVSYVPQKMSSVYISINNTFRFLFAALAPITAGIFLNTLKNISSIYVWGSFFIVSSILFTGVIFLISKMTYIREEN